MTTRTCAFLGVLGAALSLACNQKGEPPSEFNLAMGEGSAKLMPIRLVKRDKAGLTAAASTTEGPAASASTASSGGPAEAAAVTIDDSSAEAAANSFAAVMNAHKFGQLADIVVPEQKEAIQAVADAFQPILDAVAADAELKKAVSEKFPGHAIAIAGLSGDPLAMIPRVTVANVKETDGDNAEATIQTQGPMGDKDGTIKLKKIDGKWRVEVPDTIKAPPPEAAQKLAEEMGKITEACKTVAKKVTDSEITDEKAVDDELRKAVGAAAAPAPADDKAASSEPPKDQASNTPPANPKGRRDSRQRPREEVDEVYSGPGQLRGH